ncbi:DinB family protein [Nocardioides mangrovicus]|uniref:DinB family protein n=1 Tax=Nocardioides mangrovicus TaxID=2478913 RepID=A0A3L8P045_9ACTN|nr:DinB family protein [Nocardioides mangrovicus]
MSDLAGLEIRDCEVSGLKIVDCYGEQISIGGGFDRVVVNDVDVTAFVEGELDRQHPARALAREAVTAEDYRAAWSVIGDDWRRTFERAGRLPQDLLHERVDDEWSFVETHRHLLFAADAWVGNAVLEEDDPYHPLGFPAGAMPEADAAGLGLRLSARPSLEEVLAARRDRTSSVQRFLDSLTDDELDRVCGRKPADPYPDDRYVVRRCLTVVLKEEAEHHRYAVRDLAVLESR